MVRSALAFCPGHISGYFSRITGESFSLTGSVGSGIVIDEGVRVEAREVQSPFVRVRNVDRTGAVTAELNGSAPLEYVMQRLGVCAGIVTECRLPIGAGFGLSAAALLAAITALNSLFELGLSGHDVAGIAHEAEILHRTGLGDVAACQDGGLACRCGPGIDAEIIRLKDIDELLYAVSFGPLETPAVLDSSTNMERIASAYPGRCPDSLADFFRLSRDFANRCGLISGEVAAVLRACDEHAVPASMTMLGNGVFAYGDEAKGVLGGFGEVWELRLASEGVRLLEEGA